MMKRFLKDRNGNVSQIFALAIIPIIGLVGVAVDYSRAATLRTQMQGALDATSLMLSKEAAGQTNAQLTTKANTYFSALFNHPEASNITITATQTTVGGSTLTVNGSGSLPTSFVKIVGLPNMTFKSSSTVKWGSSRLRVALALDTTGSMGDAGKMTALKTATKNLLTQLQGAASANGDVYVSMVPFSKNVNLGPLNYTANWIGWTDWESEPAAAKTWIASNAATWEQVGPGDSCPFTSNSHGFGCAPNPTSTSTTSTVPSSGTYSGYICPSTDTGKKTANLIGIMYNGCYNSAETTRTIATGSSASCGSTVNCSCSGSGNNKKCIQTYYTHAWVKNARSTWNGCVTDRGASSAPSQDYDRKSTAPNVSIPASLYPAEQNSYCSAEISGLSYNWAAMKTMVDNYFPLGATNQPIGLVWGWQSLVGGGPFTVPAKDSNYQYHEAIILMSDGLNTLDRWYGNGSATSTSVDKRMYDTDGTGTCANIKATGITIYSVHVNTDGDPTSLLLKNCASSADKFWTITSANQLDMVFNTIGTSLTKLRIAK